MHFHVLAQGTLCLPIGGAALELVASAQQLGDLRELRFRYRYLAYMSEADEYNRPP
jgi:hypothetical protein